MSRWRPRPQWSRWSAAGAPRTVVAKVALGTVVIATAAATVGPDEVEQRLQFGLGAVRQRPLVYAFVTADAAALDMVVRHRRQHDIVAGAERDGHILDLLAPLRPIEPAVVYPTTYRLPTSATKKTAATRPKERREQRPGRLTAANPCRWRRWRCPAAPKSASWPRSRTRTSPFATPRRDCSRAGCTATPVPTLC